ncbi:hypothetical protein GCM10027291_00340 [Telluribacter humicola]
MNRSSIIRGITVLDLHLHVLREVMLVAQEDYERYQKIAPGEREVVLSSNIKARQVLNVL